MGHPELFDDVGERLGTLGFAAADLDKLRQEVLKTLAGDHGLDSAGLKRQLIQCGFSREVDLLSAPQVLGHAFFARADAATDAAREGWEETYALYRQREFKAEVWDARNRLADDMSRKIFDQFQALKKQEH